MSRGECYHEIPKSLFRIGDWFKKGKYFRGGYIMGLRIVNAWTE